MFLYYQSAYAIHLNLYVIVVSSLVQPTVNSSETTAAHQISISAPAQLKYRPDQVLSMIPSSLRLKKENPSDSKPISSKAAFISISQNPLKERKSMEEKSIDKSKHLKDFMKDVTDIFE